MSWSVNISKTWRNWSNPQKDTKTDLNSTKADLGSSKLTMQCSTSSKTNEWKQSRNLGPYPDGRVPGGGPNGGAIRRHLEGGDSVLVTIKHSDPLALERVPQVDSVVIVTLKCQCDSLYDIGWCIPANSNLPDTLKSTALIPNSIASFS